jgi:Holliday junction resolvasome RuvABC ATP-dependent DNA helicase subunit
LDGRTLARAGREGLIEMIDASLESRAVRPENMGEQQEGLPLINYPPLVVFIDEIHLMSAMQQESLLTLLDNEERTLRTNNRILLLQQASFLFATTRPSEIDSAFRTRCDEIRLREYSHGEVTDILISRELSNVSWPREIFETISTLGRQVPRQAIALAEGLRGWIITASSDKTVHEHLEDFRRVSGIYEQGLKQDDLEYLAALEQSEGGRLGEDVLFSRLGTTDRARILEEVEPFLVRLGFLQTTARGREITPLGTEYVLAHRRNFPSVE